MARKSNQERAEKNSEAAEHLPRYDKDFFDIQLQFAQAVCKIRDQSVGEKLNSYTALQSCFGYQFNPAWEVFAKRASEEGDPLDKMYEFYLTQPLAEHPRYLHSSVSDNFGCFNFEYNPSRNFEAVAIHFTNREGAGGGPLSKDNLSNRADDLRTMLQYIKERHPNVRFITGDSWLYNLEAYRRLFPDSYTAGVFPSPDEEYELMTLGVWGQFLDNKDATKPELREQFLARLKEIEPNDILKPFPLRPLRTHGPIADFYKMYGIE